MADARLAPYAARPVERLRPAVLSLGLLLAAAAWLGALWPRAEAGWLRVEAPARALAGRTLPMRVTLSEPPGAGGWLAVDLHAVSSRREPLGFVAAAAPRPLAPATRSYDFEAIVPAGGDLGAVEVVVFLSSSGRWEDRSRAAATAAIPVVGTGAASELVPVPAYEPEPGVAAVPPASLPLRAALAAPWLLAAFAMRRRSGGLALACAAAGIWELTALGAVLGAEVRALALEHRVYYERRMWQQWASVAVGIGAVALAAVGLPGRATHASLRAALWVYAGIALTQLLSLHELDRLSATPVGPVPLVHAAAFATSLAALGAALLAPGDVPGARGGAVT